MCAVDRPGLCRLAALHYVNQRKGVKESDVWWFNVQYDDWPFLARWRRTRAFGLSNFALRRYLAARQTSPAKALAQEAAVLIYPENRADDEIVWPPSQGR